MRRVLSKLFTLTAAASAVLFAGVCVMWVRSHRRPAGSADQVVARHPRTGDRLTVRSAPGKLVVLGPPRLLAGEAPTRGSDGQTAESLAARLANQDVTWWADFEVSFKDHQIDQEVLAPAKWSAPRMPDSAYVLLAGHRNWSRLTATVYPAREQAAPLLRALDDPSRFAAAHVVLENLFDYPWDDHLEPQPDGSYVRVYGGLRVHLTPDPDAGEPDEVITPGGAIRHVQCIARVDPAQLPAVRDAWHRRLDVPAGSASYWSLAAGSATLPTAWSAAAVWRRRRRRAACRRGLCPKCGYDLRATPHAGGTILGRCPECGAAPPAPAGGKGAA